MNNARTFQSELIYRENLIFMHLVFGIGFINPFGD